MHVYRRRYYIWAACMTCNRGSYGERHIYEITPEWEIVAMRVLRFRAVELRRCDPLARFLRADPVDDPGWDTCDATVTVIFKGLSLICLSASAPRIRLLLRG